MHRLNRNSAFGLVFDKKSLSVFNGHFFLALGTTYILFSFGFSVESLQSCQFDFVLFRGIK